MKAYYIDNRCIKCGQIGANTKYHINFDDDEWMIRNCKNCEYSWREKIFDEKQEDVHNESE